MRMILSSILVFLLVFTLAACGQQSIDGVYEGKSGKVAIYDMKTMTVEKNTDGSKYKVTFSGPEQTLVFDNVDYKDNELKWSVQGFMSSVKFDGKKAVFTYQFFKDAQAIFEKTDNPIPKVAEAVKTSEPVPTLVRSENNKAIYPEALIGKWAMDNGDKSCANAVDAEKQTGMWDGLDIQKDGMTGMEFSCTLVSVSGVEGVFTAAENCSAQGDEYKETNVYKINAKTMQVTTDNGSGNKSQASYRLCK